MDYTDDQINRVNLLDMSWSSLRQWVKDLGEPSFRADQLVQWVHQHRCLDFDCMTNLSKGFRKKLHEHAVLSLPELVNEAISNDGTRKWLCRLDDANLVETVFIPDGKRGTLCVSSQVGCGLNCSFCATGKEGFNRNLSLSEIIGQLWLANEALAKANLPLVTNVVMMGMGEPLLNFDAVVAAMELMLADKAYGLSKYRVTLSTSGLVPQMEKLKDLLPVSMALSLHAPTDAVREQLVPLNKKYPLSMLMETAKNYYSKTPARSVMFEYVMLEGVNDSLKQAKELINLVSGVPCKINLIPFNSFPGTQYKSSPMPVIQAFSDRLRKAGLVSTIRKTRGLDTDSACGMLVGEFSDRTARRERWQRTGKIVPIPVVLEA